MTENGLSEMTFEQRVKALGASRAMTQEDLGDLAGIGLATVQRGEGGLPAAPATMASLAAVFDMSASELASDDRRRRPTLRAARSGD